MNLGKQLYDLQQTDLNLEAKAVELKLVENQLSNNQALTQAQAELDRKQDYLADLGKKQKTAEWKVDDLQAKLNPLQKELYTGSVKNPKELLSIQQQVESLKTQINVEEDGILEIMSQVEVIQKEMESETAKLENLKDEWQKRQETLLVEQQELKLAIDIAKQKRSELAATVEPMYIEIYKTLRVTRQGQAVAKIEQGRCKGCRITLPMGELQQVRMGELVQCSSCSRILCLG